MVCPAVSSDSLAIAEEEEQGGPGDLDDVPDEYGQEYDEAVASAEHDGKCNIGDAVWDESLCGSCEDGADGAHKALGLRNPFAPKLEDVLLHNLTHLPYRSWCPHCVATRRSNTPHLSHEQAPSAVSLLTVDYCYVRDDRDQELITGLVGRVYPSS